MRALHADGYNVLIGGVSVSAAQILVEQIDPSGERVVACALDVREQNQFEAALDFMLQRWGTVQVVVNNAGVTAAKPSLEITPEEFDAVLAVNLRGTFIGCQVFGRHFKAKGHGRIINMASLAGQNGGTATGAHYAASKGGILTLTKVFARDLGPFGVTVNAVAPGPLESPAVRRTVSPEKLAQLIEGIPVGALGDPHYIAELVVSLASVRSAFVNGATWDVNGGLFMR